MRKNLILAKSNLRKAKGQTAAIAVLALLAAAMLNLWLMLAMDYRQNFDRCHERLHDGHATFVFDANIADTEEFVADMLEKEQNVTEYGMEDSMSVVGSFAYNGGETNTDFVLLEKQTALTRPVGRMEIVEDSAGASGIYLPMLYKTGDIETGSTIDIQIGSYTVSYTVCGFFNSAMAGSHNCSMCALLLTGDKYDELKEKGYAPQSVMLSVRLRDKSQSEEFEASVKNRLAEKFPDVRVLGNSYTVVTTSRYISQMICSGIVSAMAFFILIIALVVISSNILNYIQENMKNLGALKAAGYTARQLVRALEVQFLGICLAAALAGIGLSYLLFPGVNAMMVSQTGIPYEMRFLPVPCVCTLGSLCGMAAAAVWLSSRRIRRLEPIAALRQGMQTHNFKRSWVPLEKSRLPVSAALALKTTCAGIRQNVIICVTMLVISLIVVFSGLMTANMIVDMEPFITLIVGETADSCINISPDIEETFLRRMNQDKRVQGIYLYHSEEVRHAGGIVLTATMSGDFSKANNQKVCVEGRFPKYDNETAVAIKYAKEHGLGIGDEITFQAEGKEAVYLICGYTQISNNLGKDCLLTREGYERMGTLNSQSYYLNLAEGTDIDAFNQEINERYKGSVYAVMNVAAIIDGAAGVYVTMMKMIVAAILVLSMIVTAFVLYLLVRTMLNHKKQEYGILKALGFTTGQLIVQTALSFMPAMVLSMAAGLVISSFAINPLVAVFLSGIGIVKCTFPVPAGFIAVLGTGIVLLAFGMVCLMSVRIRKIVPKVMLAGE